MSEKQNNSPGWELKTDNANAVVFFYGNWNELTAVSHLPSLPPEVTHLSLDTTELGKWDSSFTSFLYNINELCTEKGIELSTDGVPHGALKLLVLSSSTQKRVQEKKYVPGLFESIGITAANVISACDIGISFVGALLIALFKLLSGKARMQWRDVWHEIIKAGPDAFFIVSLIAFLMGLILAFIGAIPLKWFRAEIYVSSLIGIGMFRLMGAVMTGVVMAGRTGAAFAAEIGTMQVNEEVDALESMGIPPMEFLVLPRFIALTLMLPFLCIFADLIGIIGGMVVGVCYLDLSVLEYWQKLFETTKLADLFVGLFTSFVFGILISICGCLRGLRCGRNSAAVGQATTAAMVSSIICLVISTSIITVVTVTLNI